MATRRNTRTAAVDLSLGQAIRTRRIEHGHNVSALARAAGISSSALSQIEHGRVQPSVATLRRIAASLGIPVFGLMDPAPEADLVVVKAGQRKTLGLPGSPVIYQLLSPNLSGHLEVLYYEVEVGGVTSEGGASHPGEECCFILRGSGRLEIAGRVFELDTGDAITYSGEAPHALRNVGDETLVAISAVTPPSF